MKNLALIGAGALLAVLSLPQKAQTQPAYYGYNPQNDVQFGVPSAQLGGATVYPDGSFSNNGYSWNGADPAGGWRGNVTPVYQAAPAYYRTRAYRAPVYYGGHYHAQAYHAAPVYHAHPVHPVHPAHPAHPAHH